MYVSAVAYIGVAVVTIELTEAVSDALLFPDWTYRLVTFLLILAFPLVLVLSWIFDITGKGVVRTGAGGSGEASAGTALSPRSAGAGSAVPVPVKPRAPGSRIAMPAPRRRRHASRPELTEIAGETTEVHPDRVRRATLAHMRHELRTPINGIIGYADMLLEDVEELELDGYTGDLERIRAGGRKLLSLIDDVLGEGAADADRALESYAQKIRVELRTPVTSVIGYAEILLESAEEEGRENLAPDLERIRSSAERLLELSGDIVSLATEGEKAAGVDGSEVSNLTRSVLSKIHPAGGESAGEAEGRLLVVDDNAMNRDLLSRQLARDGYIVLTAEDGAQALEMLPDQGVDLILLDVIMPNMDGVETLTRLKSDERLGEIPVLMLSSLDEMDGALRCIEMGAEDYLSKPVKPAVLQARIAANLELHRMRERERAYEARVAADEGFIDRLLQSAFPDAVAERYRSGDPELADVVPEATVLSCQLRGFTAPTSSGDFSERLKGLQELCVGIEALARAHGVETCIWRADGFLAVAGAPTPAENHVNRAVALARALLQEAGRLQGGNGDRPLRLGMGLHTGPVAAGALGGERLRYEVWGEGVKTAEAVARSAPDGGLVASPPAYSRLKESFTFEAQQVREIAGIQMRTYLLQ